MPKFKYVAIDAEGQQVSGVQDASDRAALGTALFDRNLLVQKIDDHKSILQFEITQKKVPKKDLMHFSRQLAAFMRSGVPILDALRIIEGETGNKLFKEVLADIALEVESGETFSGAAAKHPEAFPPVYLGMLESAELTGNLPTVLVQLAAYLERDMEAKRKVKSALMYPGVVAAMSVATVGVLAGFVLPRFKDFFESLDATLPLPTRMLLGFTDLTMKFWFFFPMLMVLAGFGVFWMIKTERGRDFRDRRLLQLPIIGEILRHAILERFCRVLASMARAGVPMPQAMIVIAGSMNNTVYKNAIIEARQKMLEGHGLAGPIAETGLFPGAARQMIRVGEETGTLHEQLEAASAYYEQELDYKINKFTAMFEPAVIVFMGVVVGFVAIALVTAMYGVFGQVEL